MDEARAVLTRLKRIDILQAEGADGRALLAEVKALLVEAEAWIGAEGGDERAADALERCRAAVENGRSAMMAV